MKSAASNVGRPAVGPSALSDVYVTVPVSASYSSRSSDTGQRAQ